MSDMLGVIFYEQRSMATKFGLIEVPYGRSPQTKRPPAKAGGRLNLRS
jgi:hypothetical protein